MLGQRKTGEILTALAFDLMGTVATFLLARELRFLLPWGMEIYSEQQSVAEELLLFILPLWLIIFSLLGIYDPSKKVSPLGELQSIFTAGSVALFMLAGVLFFSFRDTSRLFILYFYASNMSVLLGWRVIRYIAIGIVRAQDNDNPQRALIVGVNDLSTEVEAALDKLGRSQVRLVGFVDDTVEKPVLGSLSDVTEIISAQRIDTVFIALPHIDHERLSEIILEIQSMPVQLWIVPNYLELALYRARAENFNGLPFINLRETALTPYQRVVKRLFDLIVTPFIMLPALPLMAAIAIAVKLDSPGPVIFRQQRAGENGRLFNMLKFRSMFVDAEARATEMVQSTDDGEVKHKDPDDPRVTHIGKFIRRTSLDELPQLFNVLKGEMSLVGPRPEMPWLVEKYKPWQRQRFTVPQGMTGWWQVNGRSDNLMHQNTDKDLYYIQHYSILLDLKILIRTVRVVIEGKGAF
jgi:exopolysaccharide biosynthesis polyprenyl glycosylphosphotransferase